MSKKSPKSRDELLTGIIHLSKNIPDIALADETVLVTCLLDLLYDEQNDLSDTAKAMLTGVAATLLSRVKIPAAKFTDEHGNKLWTLEQVADYLNKPLAEVEKDAEALIITTPGKVHGLQ